MQQICRVERRRCLLRRGTAYREEVEVTYAITSAPRGQADAARLLGALRGHWAIENEVHYVRDVAMDEDRCQIRSGAAPQAVAACRNLALTLLRRAGHRNIAAALRTYAARPRAAANLVLSDGSL